MDPGVQLLIWIAGVHFVGFLAVAVLMLPALHDDSGGQDQDGESDGGGGGPKVPRPRSGPPCGGFPLPDAVQASLRHRGTPLRLGDLQRARRRRPSREPVRRPARVGQPRR
jgi:hypothetical protein